MLSGGAPTPAGTSGFSKHNWDMEMDFWLNGWTYWVVMDGAFISLSGWGVYDLIGGAFVSTGREFKGTETFGHAMTGKGTPLKTSIQTKQQLTFS